MNFELKSLQDTYCNICRSISISLPDDYVTKPHSPILTFSVQQN